MNAPDHRSPQRLAPKELTVCEACLSRVYFRVCSTQATTDPSRKIAYLKCPVCGATATQLVEVEEAARRPKKPPRKKYRYSSML